jgi:DNA-binding MarR family transcriptional regulator
LYNQELRSGEIEITQFTILTALDRAGELSQGKLGKLLALDSTITNANAGAFEEALLVRRNQPADPI